MPEESEMLEQSPEQERLANAQTEKQRNVANNAQNLKVVADAASKSADPYVKAAGLAVKAADKLTGGKTTEHAGKRLNRLANLSPQGKMLQKASNKLAESGTSERIGQALSKKNNNAPTSGNVGGKSDATVKDKDSGFFSKKEVHDQASDGGGVSFQATVKFLKTGLIAFAPVMVVVIFMNLIVAGSQTYLKVVGLDKADKVTNSQAEGAIEKHASESLLEQETDDDNVNDGVANIGYIYDEFIEDGLYKQKFSKMNFVAAKSSNFSESEISELKDYYSDINSYENGEYDMDTVYNFFFKLLYIERHYKNSYGIELDMPLIMSVLTVRETDISDVFVSNTKDYRVNSLIKGSKENNKYFKYDYDWSNHKLSKNDSTHDIEILAQGMVKKTSDSGCPYNVGSDCYALVSREEYQKFLKGFLEKKYFSNSDNEGAVNNIITQIYDAKEQYEDLVGDNKGKEEIIPVSSNSYWWPIGSKETEEINGVLYAKGDPQVAGVTSNYGAEEDIRIDAHGGIDIGNGGYGVGVINIIASKSGEVVYPTSDYQTQYPDNGSLQNNDGYSYGNFVKIKHSDGSYTIYAHLAQNSITVRAGDVVAQGQVIGKMGHSGRSTGAHLHFEIRVGTDAKSGRVNPLKHVSPENPRTMSYSSGSSFSLTTTTLSKEEFVSKMKDYYNRTKKDGFYKNFVSNAGEVYDTSLANGVNPELVVVTAGTEQNWTLPPACQYTNNYWGIGIGNGEGCNAGGKYDSLSEGIAAYAQVLSSYNQFGSRAEAITKRYNERVTAGCDASGHGLPGTLEGMQSLYSWIGDYRWNPGNSGSGGCYYFDYMYGKDYCQKVATCASKVATDNCPVESKTTVCEQNDYTAYQIKKKVQMRYDIFGL